MDETLGRNILKEREEANIHGIRMTRGIKVVNNAQFADDIVLLGGYLVINANIFKQTLDHFLYVFQGEVNKVRCKIFGWNVTPRLM